MNITQRMYGKLQNTRPTQTLKIVEHSEKDDAPQRISLMIYGGITGLAVVTLEKSDKWGISDVKSDSHYNKVVWPVDVFADPDDDGACTLIDLVMESVGTFTELRA